MMDAAHLGVKKAFTEIGVRRHADEVASTLVVVLVTVHVNLDGNIIVVMVSKSIYLLYGPSGASKLINVHVHVTRLRDSYAL